MRISPVTLHSIFTDLRLLISRMYSACNSIYCTVRNMHTWPMYFRWLAEMRKVSCHFYSSMEYRAQSTVEKIKNIPTSMLLIQILVRPSSRLPADQYLLEILCYGISKQPRYACICTLHGLTLWPFTFSRVLRARLWYWIPTVWSVFHFDQMEVNIARVTLRVHTTVATSSQFHAIHRKFILVCWSGMHPRVMNNRNKYPAWTWLIPTEEQSAVGNLDERDREIPLVAAQNRGQQSAGGPILSQKTLRQHPNSRGDNIRLSMWAASEPLCICRRVRCFASLPTAICTSRNAFVLKSSQHFPHVTEALSQGTHQSVIPLPW